MYSVKTNVLELTALMKQHGITRAVLSPGSRNSPLNHTLASCPDILCTPVTDERSAAFTANGLCQALRRPVAACCTSGTALLDMAPAVAEAYYQNLPLLIISADRPASAIGQMDGQTIVQPGSFHNYIRKEVTLPEPHDAESLWYCNRLINEALAELTHNGFGPVHINVPITEPLFDMSAPALPEVRSFVREQSRMAFLTPDMRNEWRKAKRVMIICGQSLPAPAKNPSDALPGKGMLLSSASTSRTFQPQWGRRDSSGHRISSWRLPGQTIFWPPTLSSLSRDMWSANGSSSICAEYALPPTGT